MVSKSPSVQAKQIEQDVSNILRKFDITRQTGTVRENILDLRQDLANTRIYTGAYELSETPEEQRANARQGRQWLAKANSRILKASEYNIFGPVDVAHLGAQIDQLRADLK